MPLPKISRDGDVLRVETSREDRSRVRLVEGWVWDAKTGTWEFPVETRVVRALSRMFDGRVEIAGDVPHREEEWPEGLFEYQKEGATFLADTRRALLADDMGLGKTAQAIAASLKLGQKILVACPASVKWAWGDEIAWLSPEATVQVVDGERSKRIGQITGEPTFTIINLESLRLYADEIARVPWDVFVIDEAHKIKNRYVKQTKRGPQVTKVSVEIAKRVPCVFLLTGTPILNRPDELWSLLHCIQPKIFSSYWKFVSRYCTVTHDGYGMVVGSVRPEMREELRDLCKLYSLRRTKLQKLDLPSITTQQIWVDLRGEQSRIYREMAEDMYTDLRERGAVSASVVIAQITRLKQITIDPLLMLGSPPAGLQGAKVDALMDVLEGAGTQKVVVFSQFARALEGLSSRLAAAEIPHGLFTGKTPARARHDLVTRFQTDPRSRLLLISTQAGGLGLTLTAASVAVFLDKLWTPAGNAQAAARLHRIGQTVPVTIVELLARNSVEEGIERMLATKEQDFRDLFDLDAHAVASAGPRGSEELRELLRFGL